MSSSDDFRHLLFIFALLLPLPLLFLVSSLFACPNGFVYGIVADPLRQAISLSTLAHSG